MLRFCFHNHMPKMSSNDVLPSGSNDDKSPPAETSSASANVSPPDASPPDMSPPDVSPVDASPLDVSPPNVSPPDVFPLNISPPDASPAPLHSPNAFTLVNAYSFRGRSDEFTVPHHMNHSSFKQLTGKFLSTSTRLFSEYPLSMFGSWYEDLPLVNRLMEYHSGVNCDERWNFKVFVLNPSALAASPIDRQNFDWALSLAKKFYLLEFTGHEDDEKCINMAVNLNITIMLVGCRCPKKDVFGATKSIAKRKEVVAIAAVTYRHGLKDECGSSLILWFLVAPPAVRMPRDLTSWRRLGLGRLMLIMVIKFSTIELLGHLEEASCALPLPGVDIYLQATQRNACAFYQSCGFVPINSFDSNGLELLPNSLRQFVEGEGKTAAASEYAWIQTRSDDIMVPLFRLRSGGLLNSAVDVLSEAPDDDAINEAATSEQDVVLIENRTSHVTPSSRWKPKMFRWCNFPSRVGRASHRDAKVLLTMGDLHSAYDGLALLDELLPPPMEVLLHPSKMRLRGDLLSIDRFSHSASGGKTWMLTCELEMMLSLIMRDGRYDSSVTIIPFEHMQKIEHAFDAFKSRIEYDLYPKKLSKKKRADLNAIADKMFKDVEKTNPKEAKQQRSDMVSKGLYDFRGELEQAMTKKFPDVTEEQLERKYETEMNRILQEVLVYHRGILEKKVIVFPINFGNSHWGVTFVFNAGDMKHDKDESEDGTSSPWMPCFFRYCSIDPSGSRTIPNKHGIVWFLNLAYSSNNQFKRIDEMANNNGPSPTLIWLTPFGTQISNNMLGTSKFPALRVPEEGVLPQQVDVHSCGIGMVAGIAILLRQVIGRSTVSDTNKFNAIFSRDSMVPEKTDVRQMVDKKSETVSEHVCSFPEGSFLPLPTKEDLVVGSYLHVLKAQWFTMFDRLAELQHITLPNREAKEDRVVDVDYQTLKDELQKFPWPKHPLQTNVKAITDNDGDANDVIIIETVPKNDEPSAVPPASPPQHKIEASRVPPEESDDMKTEVPRMVPEDDEPSAVPPASPPQHKIEAPRVPPAEESNDMEMEGPRMLPDDLPAADLVWVNGPPSKEEKPFDVEKAERCTISLSRYKPNAHGYDFDNFVEKWRTKKNEKRTPVLLTKAQQSEMEKFVEDAFLRWNWSSTADHNKELESVRNEMKQALKRSRGKLQRAAVAGRYDQRLKFMKKERRLYRRVFELEWKFGTSALVTGLKHNPMNNQFTARIEYKVRNVKGMSEMVEESIPVSEDWIKDAAYEPGVIQHVINLGLANNFVEVPLGRTFHIQTKKVHSLRYVHPTVRFVPADVGVTESNDGNLTEPMEKVNVAGYWMVLFEGEKEAIRVDDAFVSFLPAKFLDEVKRMRCGFVDIPVGTCKVSHLHEHPHLVRHDAPSVKFTQSDGEDLCVSNSLASVLHTIGFAREAMLLHKFGKDELAGGTVNALDRACRFASGILPKWITRYNPKKPEDFDWGPLYGDVMKRTIVVGVLNESDGNASHAVTIHGGYIYDANETVAIGLCMDGLNYCCSTATVKNTFVNFRRLTTFFYDGNDKNKQLQMMNPSDRIATFNRLKVPPELREPPYSLSFNSFKPLRSRNVPRNIKTRLDGMCSEKGPKVTEQEGSQEADKGTQQSVPYPPIRFAYDESLLHPRRREKRKREYETYDNDRDDVVFRLRGGGDTPKDGFVDIPVGDFKVSHLEDHPNLRVPDAPLIQFSQIDGQDLCVSKALASVLHVLGFTEEATQIDQYGQIELAGGLAGGAVNIIDRVGQFASGKLPAWITRKVIKRPHYFDWELLREQMENTILLGVLYESDGNASHAVAIHGGYVYDANEAVALPLCQEALDYCCSTQAVQNQFVNFRKATLFFYDGKQKDKIQKMTPLRKRKRDDAEQGKGKREPKIVRTRYIYL